MTSVGLINYGSGNFCSVLNALRYLKVKPIEISKPHQMSSVDRFILPGVGSFPATMDKLRQLRLIDTLKKEVLLAKKPFLGICVGMQILADVGYEFSESAGLGLIPGKVVKLNRSDSGLPVPHIGWNEVILHRECPLFASIRDSASFYFVHSFHHVASDPATIVASTDYGQPVAACIQRENVFGVQFHPEKSQRDGLRLLENFCTLQSDWARPIVL